MCEYSPCGGTSIDKPWAIPGPGPCCLADYRAIQSFFLPVLLAPPPRSPSIRPLNMTTEPTPTSIMATRTIIPPLARGDSKPIDANKPFIIRDLPAEIRNQIISYLVEYPTPMRISCNSTESRPYRIDIHGFRLCPKLQLPVNLFASCRTLYRDAGSAFYSNHTFIIDSRYCSYSCHRYSPIIRLPGAFFTRIGTQAQWLRKIELDLCLLTKSKLY
jgi:hypothetical protein